MKRHAQLLILLILGFVSSGFVIAKTAAEVLVNRASLTVQNPAKWYIVIGGPGMGKTSVIEELKKRGHATIQEAATDVILYMQGQGIAQPWVAPDFQTKISLLHAARELIAEQKQKPVVFFDRGPVDSLSYMLFYNSPHQHRLVDLIENVLARKMYQPTVFYLEELNFCETTEVRHEDLSEAKKLGEKFIEDYASLGFTVIKIPSMSVKHRVDAILAYVSKEA